MRLLRVSRAATGDYIVMIDADGSMDPREIPDFIAILDGGAHYAKGSRFCTGGGSDDISRLRRAGNMFLNWSTSRLFGTKYSDLCYGYNALRRECTAIFALPAPHDSSVDAYWGDGFEIETLINIRAAKAKLTIAEVPSFESHRISGVSNLRTFRDGVRVFATIMRECCTRTQLSVNHLDSSRSAMVDVHHRLERTDRSEAV